MAWAAEEAERCPQCGHSRAETMDPANQGRYAVTAWECQACAARNTAAQADQEAYGAAAHSLQYTVRLLDG